MRRIRETFRLHLQAGLSYSEIARALKISKSVAGKYVSLAGRLRTPCSLGRFGARWGGDSGGVAGMFLGVAVQASKAGLLLRRVQFHLCRAELSDIRPRLCVEAELGDGACWHANDLAPQPMREVAELGVMAEEHHAV